MERDDIPEIRSEDFDSIIVHLSFVNVTTKTEVKQGKRYLGEQLQAANQDHSRIDLIEFHENGMTIEVPSRSGATGHQLNINLWTENAKPHDLNISFIVTVDVVERMSPERDQYQVSFNEYDSKTWKEFQSIYERRQNDINEFLKAARGY